MEAHSIKKKFSGQSGHRREELAVGVSQRVMALSFEGAQALYLDR
jgi:hypothetical protein